MGQAERECHCSPRVPTYCAGAAAFTASVRAICDWATRVQSRTCARCTQ